MKNKFLVCVGLILAVSPSFASEAIIKTLAPLKSEKYSMNLSRYKVRGSNSLEMLEDYAKRIKEFEEGYTVSLRLSADQIPNADDGDEIVGLTKIIDVVYLITDPTGGGDFSKQEEKHREGEVRNLLFKVRDLGGQIGVESYSWSTCGLSFPGVIILDVKAKEVISISPENTEC